VATEIGGIKLNQSCLKSYFDQIKSVWEDLFGRLKNSRRTDHFKSLSQAVLGAAKLVLLGITYRVNFHLD